MFISNIICKLPVIIYKPRIICKGYNNPYKQGSIVTLNYYKYRFHQTFYTSHHTLCTRATSLCLHLSLSLSLSLTRALLKHILALSSSFIFLFERWSPLFCKSILLLKVPLQADVQSSGPHLTMSTWRITVLNFGKNIWRLPWGCGKIYPMASRQFSHSYMVSTHSGLKRKTPLENSHPHPATMIDTDTL